MRQRLEFARSYVLTDHLTFEGLEKAKRILEQQGYYPLYPNLEFECGCGIFDDKIKSCKYHAEGLKEIAEMYLKPTEGEVEIREVFGIKLVR